MTQKEKINRISNYMNSLFPNAHCELEYNKDYESSGLLRLYGLRERLCA